MSTKSLPPNPSIKQLKIQAKDFLKPHKTGDVAVCEILRLLRRFSNSTENEILEADVSLKDVQFALALSYGFKGWEQLAEYVESVIQAPVEEKNTAASEEYDERYDEAIALVTKTRQATISMIQRHLRIGYIRAARIIETMEREGVVGPFDGVKSRDVLVPN